MLSYHFKYLNIFSYQSALFTARQLELDYEIDEDNLGLYLGDLSEYEFALMNVGTF